MTAQTGGSRRSVNYGSRLSALDHGGGRMSGCKEDVPYAEVFLIPPQPRAESRPSLDSLGIQPHYCLDSLGKAR